MSLPTIAVPRYQITLLSDGTKLKYRPFLVKEEKVLHMAMESDDTSSQIDAMINVISACTDKDEDYVKSLPVFDIEYLFLQIRSKSVSEIVKPVLKCKHCKKSIEASIDLSKIGAKKSEKHTNKIQLTDDIGVIMKYPTIVALGTSVAENENSSDLALDIVIDCIDYIYDKKQTYKSSEYTKEELVEFVDNITKEHFDKISEFFETMPKVKKEIKFKCPKCNKNNSIQLEGIENFFG
tara:strand:- start:851 stop:1561 length:711 start_codon:yes stop_codon:yes gene_type:complete